MNKRIKRKLHKKYIIDIAYYISLSPLWRKRLFDSKYGEKFTISYQNLYELPQYVKKTIARYKLNYFVYKTEEILDEDFYYEGGVFFKFESVKFKGITNYSFNNTEVI